MLQRYSIFKQGIISATANFFGSQVTEAWIKKRENERCERRGGKHNWASRGAEGKKVEYEVSESQVRSKKSDNAASQAGQG